MVPVIDFVRRLFKSKNKVRIDNSVFRLHYKFTASILTVFCLLVTIKQCFSDPIVCIFEGREEDVVDLYCWNNTTYKLPDMFQGADVAEGPHPGVAPDGIGEEKEYYPYYQWVPFVLLIQEILFILPHLLWRMWEGGRIKTLAEDARCPGVSREERNAKKEELLIYFLSQFRSQDSFAYAYFVCELLNLVNVVSQMLLIGRFLGGPFTTYGLDVFALTNLVPEQRSDPMSSVFPKIIKCVYSMCDPSGSIQNVDGLCILPENVKNEQIYVALWFWFFALSVISGAASLFRASVHCSPRLRGSLLRARSPYAVGGEVGAICRACHIGDWLLLYQLAENLDPQIYKELVADLAARLAGNKPPLHCAQV